MIRVVIGDDQELVREGFRMIIDREDDLEVVGQAADGRAAVHNLQGTPGISGHGFRRSSA